MILRTIGGDVKQNGKEEKEVVREKDTATFDEWP